MNGGGNCQQAGNIYLLTQVEGLAVPDGADVDLRLGCPMDYSIALRNGMNPGL